MAEHASADSQRSATIVVENALAAQQWELHLAADAVASRLPAWETPPLRPYAAWLDELWLELGAGEGLALSPHQSRVLWRRIVAESAESSDLIGHAGAADWAAEAWELLHRWQIDPREERAAADQVDYRAFLAWSRSYRAWLDEHGLFDRAELEAVLPARMPAGVRLIFADLDEPYPSRATLLAQLAARGQRVEAIAAPAVTGTRRAARLADAAEELQAAFAWAARRLSGAPQARIAVVVPAARRAHELERLAATLPADACSTAYRSLAAEPTIGAARDALALAAAHSSYATFARWLRSPFFAAARDESIARARLDTELRRELRSQLDFAAAYRCGVAELLAARAPLSANALAAALAAVGDLRHATPSRWAHLFARFLTAIGWQPPAACSVLLAWQSTLDALSRLTPIVGDISLDAALREIGRLVERPVPVALPVHGIHVIERIGDVGPGYDAVWVTGFTDDAWPEPPRGNPLLPVAMQRARGLPYSSPRDAQARSARALDRLVRRSRELVISWPARVYDYETEASPAIRAWPQLSADELSALTRGRALPAARRETVADDAPPLAGSKVAGGTAPLGRQARCPLRAFLQDRLGARELEPLGFGVPPRLRGIAVHRAVEALLADLPAQAAFTSKVTAIAPSVERALARLFGRARGRLAALYDLEAEQLEQVLTTMLRGELARGAFRVLAVEQRAAVAVGPLLFDVRIDRVDELADGTLAIIDYKTGERATSADWFGPRLRDAQVPLYAAQANRAVGAAVVVRLAPDQTRYFGLWPDGAFPGRSAKAANGDIAGQLTIWRTQVAQLAEEFAAGDTRVFGADYEDAKGAYAPLTRVFEQLALARGVVRSW